MTAPTRSAAARIDAMPLQREGVALLPASDVPMEPVQWLWRPLMARGKLHLLAGQPGEGKTAIAMALAATVSQGGVWPDGTRCTPGNVVVWSGEDDPADTLIPRLAAMGANLDRVFFVGSVHRSGKEAPFDPARDMPKLSQAALTHGGASLIVLDPIMSAVSGESNNAADVRRSLDPVARLAQTLGAAVLGVHHFSKGSAGRSPLDRITGSLAFGAVVRVALAVATVKDADGTSRRIMAVAKNNIGPHDLAFEYELQVRELKPGIECPAVAWGRQLQGPAAELLADAPQPDDKHSALGDAKDWLREYLTCSTPSNTVEADSKAAGHAWATIRRASDSLGVKKTRGANGVWYWQLAQPSQAQKP